MSKCSLRVLLYLEWTRTLEDAILSWTLSDYVETLNEQNDVWCTGTSYRDGRKFCPNFKIWWLEKKKERPCWYMTWSMCFPSYCCFRRRWTSMWRWIVTLCNNQTGLVIASLFFFPISPSWVDWVFCPMNVWNLSGRKTHQLLGTLPTLSSAHIVQGPIQSRCMKWMEWIDWSLTAE